MHLPYTYHYSEAVSVASQSVAAALVGVVWARPFRRRAATVLFVVSICTAALLLFAPAILTVGPLGSDAKALLLLQLSATLATATAWLNGPRWFGCFAIAGQAALLELASYVRESNYELAFAHLFWCGLLLGVHALRAAPPSRSAPAIDVRTFRRQDLAIFFSAVVLALVVTIFVFGRLTYNGDEIANTFQANVYSHFRAYAPIPPCPESTRTFDKHLTVRADHG